MSESSDSIDDDEVCSVDSIDIDAIIELDTEESRVCYLCKDSSGEEGIYDRSDLMDGGKHQKMVLAFERRHPIPWDPCCPFCDGEGCEECECPDCERNCRFFCGINYGCPHHPVV